MFTHTIRVEAYYEDQDRPQYGGYTLFYNPEKDTICNKTWDLPNTPANTSIKKMRRTICNENCILDSVTIIVDLKKDNDIIATFCKNNPYTNFPDKNISLKDLYIFYEALFKNHQWTEVSLKTVIKTPSPYPNLKLTYQYINRNIEYDPYFILYAYYDNGQSCYSWGCLECSSHETHHIITLNDKKYTAKTSLEISDIIRDSFKSFINQNKNGKTLSEHEKIRLLRDLEQYSCEEFLDQIFINEDYVNQIQESIDPLLNRIPKKTDIIKKT